MRVLFNIDIQLSRFKSKCRTIRQHTYRAGPFMFLYCVHIVICVIKLPNRNKIKSYKTSHETRYPSRASESGSYIIYPNGFRQLCRVFFYFPFNIYEVHNTTGLRTILLLIRYWFILTCFAVRLLFFKSHQPIKSHGDYPVVSGRGWPFNQYFRQGHTPR